MKSELQKVLEISENVLINNASRDFTEFSIFKFLKESGKTLVFINETLEKERILKNFFFLDPNLKILFLEEPSEIYNFSLPNTFLIAEKIRNIGKLISEKYDLIILDYKLLLRKLPSKSFFKTFEILKRGEKFGHTKLVNKLFSFGFSRCDTAFEFGEFAVRGFIIDVGTLEGFFRIEFDGEEISGISRFNTETQRKDVGGKHFESLEISPIKEVVLTSENLQYAKRKCFEFGFENTEKIITEMQDFGKMSLHNYLPLFYETTENILNFLPENCKIIINESLKTNLQFMEQNLKQLETLYLKEKRNILPLNLNLFPIP